ncbi:MAG: glycosyltransferase, partial [Lachnospiraceae bacterium]|nr:glycosyltransferase [Lachnospiraceae bacterium]
MKDYKISIIVPVYNAENYLEKCVDSLLHQTYCNLEILLIDDGSKDASGQICDEYAKKDTRIRAVHKENGGLVSAWKKGVEVSSGQYLCFVDSDDWVDEQMIEEMAEHLTGKEREIVASDYVFERDDGSRQFVWQELPPGEYLKKDMKEKVIPNLLGKESRYVAMSRCMKLISRILIEENQKYSSPEIIVGEDSTIMLPALIDCNRLFIMDHKAYYHYLYVRESMVHKYDSRLYENIQKLVEVVRLIIKDKFSGEEQTQRLTQVDQ